MTISPWKLATPFSKISTLTEESGLPVRPASAAFLKCAGALRRDAVTVLRLSLAMMFPAASAMQTFGCNL